MRSVEQPTIVADIPVGDSRVSFIGIDELFRETPYRDILGDRSRWKNFKPDDMSDEEFQRILGVDANNLKHLRLSYGMTRLFLSYCAIPPSPWGDKPIPEASRFNEQEQIILLITAITHDWGEASVGDVAQPDKTKKSEIKEFKELLRIANETTQKQHSLFGTVFRYTEPVLRHTPSEFYHSFYRGLRKLTHGEHELFGKIHESIDKTLLASGTKLARAFNAIENIGYHRTGLRAWERSKTMKGRPDNMDERLRSMAFSVHAYNLGDVVRYADDYPPVFAHLVAQSHTIDSIYATNSHEAAIELQKYQGKVKLPDHTDILQQQKVEQEIDAFEARFIAQREIWTNWKEVHKDLISLNNTNG